MKRYLLDLDVVGLYSYCMTMWFGFENFREMDEESKKKLLLYLQETKGVDIKTNSEIGFLIECDLSIKDTHLGEKLTYLVLTNDW